MPDPITARYRWNPEALVQAQRMHRRLLANGVQGWLRRMFLGLILLPLIGFTIFLPVMLVMDRSMDQARKMTGFAIFLTVLVTLWSLIYGVFWKQAYLLQAARRSFRSIPGGEDSIEWTFGEDLIENRSSRVSANMRWDALWKIVEFPEGFSLYQSEAIFYWISAESFGSSDQLERFAELARVRATNRVCLGPCRYPAKPDSLFDDL